MYLTGDHDNDQCPAANPGNANSHINPTDLYICHRNDSRYGAHRHRYDLQYRRRLSSKYNLQCNGAWSLYRNCNEFRRMYFTWDHDNDQCQPPTPATPIATLIQPTCTLATGTILVTAPIGTGMTYSIGGAYQVSTTFSAMVPGPYTVTAMNSDGCISPGTMITINAQPPTPATPIATLIQPTCTLATGTIIVYIAHRHRYDL